MATISPDTSSSGSGAPPGGGANYDVFLRLIPSNYDIILIDGDDNLIVKVKSFLQKSNACLIHSIDTLCIVISFFINMI